LEQVSCKSVLTIVGSDFNVIVVEAPVGKDVGLNKKSDQREIDDRCETYTPRESGNIRR
jgi:hypothetical protein